MNKILMSMLPVLLTLLFLQACKSSTNRDQENAAINGDRPAGKDTVFKEIGVIDREGARQLVRTFMHTSNANNTKAVWFEASLIKLLYDSLYARPGRFDGVRVYFGVYPQGFPNTRADYYNRLTVFFVPTMPWQYNGHKNSLDTFIFKKDEIKNLNHGELCPNNCDSTGDLQNGN